MSLFWGSTPLCFFLDNYFERDFMSSENSGGSRRNFLKKISAGSAALALTSNLASAAKKASQKPNILWISWEDTSPFHGCYGYEDMNTPVIDAFAKEGVVYTNAHGTHGVCAPCRSSIISGLYPSSTGANNMRCSAKPANFMKSIPELMKAAGYYCTNNSKTDYQDLFSADVWDESSKTAHWRNRPSNKPFFAVFNTGWTHEGNLRGAGSDNHRNFSGYPDFLPDTDRARGNFEAMLKRLENELESKHLNKYLSELKEDGLENDTIVMLWSDHGGVFPRMKRWIYDSGTNFTLVVRVPEKFRIDGQGAPNTKNNELVSFLDFMPTVLNLAGAQIPDYLHGRAFLGANLTAERKYVHGARDRVDQRYDIIRSARDKRYKYIRNFEPWKPYHQFIDYCEYFNYNPRKNSTMMEEWRKGHKEGTLNAVQSIFWQPHKPLEELYDTETDPWEVKNLAYDPAHSAKLQELRTELDSWIRSSRDIGFVPEPLQYQMASQLGSHWAIGQKDNGQFVIDAYEAAQLWEKGVDGLSEYKTALKSNNAAVRYWGAVAIGLLGTQGLPAKSDLKSALNDDVEVVKLAAAEALMLMDVDEGAINTFKPFLREKSAGKFSYKAWIITLALNMLDNMGNKALPLKAELEQHKANKNVEFKISAHAVDTINDEPLAPFDLDASRAIPRKARQIKTGAILKYNQGTLTVSNLPRDTDRVELFSLAGKRLYSSAPSNGRTVIRSNITDGTYVIKIQKEKMELVSHKVTLSKSSGILN